MRHANKTVTIGRNFEQTRHFSCECCEHIKWKTTKMFVFDQTNCTYFEIDTSIDVLEHAFRNQRKNIMFCFNHQHCMRISVKIIMSSLQIVKNDIIWYSMNIKAKNITTSCIIHCVP